MEKVCQDLGMLDFYLLVHGRYFISPPTTHRRPIEGRPFRDQSKSSHEEKLLGLKFESPSGVVTTMATRMIDIQNEQHLDDT
ncbi:hypothetical protein CEXT_88871 [Caerostris extrusa]|uniref:Uncharacterized protein n=1 Tax=Caerostris extrusa TaxID=172846 RepID=A0AAV4XZ60_CAEEX|nr:hypothetical protein CEXT_88871 [Caerostris extrusa]